MATRRGKEGKRITTKSGNHVFVEKGKTIEEALSERFDEEYSHDIDKTDKIRLYGSYNSSLWTRPTYWDKEGTEYEIDTDKMFELFDDDSLTLDELKIKLGELVGATFGARRVGELIYNKYNKIYNQYETDRIEKFLKTIPKTEDKSIETSLKQNYKNYQESIKHPYGTKLRKEYTSNCQRCVIAYEMRRRGYDVNADKYVNDGLDRMNNNLQQSFLDYDYLKIKHYSVRPDGKKYSSRKQLIKAMEKDMLSEPEGARFIVSFDWKNWSTGHTINAEKNNGKIMFYDSQVDKSHDIQHVIDNTAIKATTLEFIRVDNLQLSKNLKGVVTWKNQQ